MLPLHLFHRCLYGFLLDKVLFNSFLKSATFFYIHLFLMFFHPPKVLELLHRHPLSCYDFPISLSERITIADLYILIKVKFGVLSIHVNGKTSLKLYRNWILLLAWVFPPIRQLRNDHTGSKSVHCKRTMYLALVWSFWSRLVSPS